MFKIGDKVREKFGNRENVYTITELDSGWVRLDGLGGKLSARSFELVDQPRQPVRGDIVQVRDEDDEKWVDREYFITTKGIAKPFMTVYGRDKGKFDQGYLFSNVSRKQMRQKPIDEPREMTLVEVCEKLGYNVKIVK